MTDAALRTPISAVAGAGGEQADCDPDDNDDDNDNEPAGPGEVMNLETRTQPAIDARIFREQQTIAAMMRLWCRDRHPAAARDDEVICADCRTLLEYAWQRLDNCPFQGAKPACNRCEVHCYSATMRERIRAVMRWAGPRMLLPHPWLSLLHLFDNRREPPRLAPRGRSGGRGG